MADIICRWRNGTPETVVELVNKLPHQKMKVDLFRSKMESLWPNFFRSPYQLACQLGLYCESEDGFYYPRFDQDIDKEEASKYLEHWINRYYIPNPYTGNDGFLDLHCPTYVIKSLYEYVLKNPNCNYSDAYRACFHDKANNNDDIVRNYINRFSKVLSFSKTGKLNKTDIDPHIIFGFMDKNNKKEFFDNFALPNEWRLMELYNRVDINKRQQMFYDYMKEQKELSESSCKQYAYTHPVNEEVLEIINKVAHKKSLFEVIDIMAIQSIYNKVLGLETNKKRGNALSATITNYKQFIDYLETAKIKAESSSDNETIVNPETNSMLQGKTDSKPLALAFLDSTFSPSQIIYYGAPGTGKSHTIKEKEDDGLHCIRTTFHPDSDYATFVGCYKPHRNRETKELTYEFVEQAFLEAYRWAWTHPEEECALVIEEINRGNCAQIFGDIFQLLDRDKDGWSTYPIKADTDISDHLEDLAIKGYGEMMARRYGEDKTGYGYLALPPNMSILATMNTSDQSLFPIDSAFKRRWDWEYIPIAQGKDEDDNNLDWRIETTAESNSWWDFVRSINTVIAGTTHSEDKELGFFFTKADKSGRISKERFVGKVVFYLWNDVFKTYGFRSDIFDKDSEGTEKLKFHDFYLRDGKVNEATVALFINNVMKHLPKEKNLEGSKENSIAETDA